MGKVGVFFAKGFEEIEALTVVDVLRRAGIEVVCVSIDGAKSVAGSHNIEVVMNKKLEEVDFEALDMIVLPGGMPGTKNLEACDALTSQVKAFYQQGKLIGAICAAPSIFGHMGLLEGKEACIYPGMEDELYNAKVSYEPVMQVKNIITSRGMGTAIPFALKIVEQFFDLATAQQLGKDIVYL